MVIFNIYRGFLSIFVNYLIVKFINTQEKMKQGSYQHTPPHQDVNNYLTIQSNCMMK